MRGLDTVLLRKRLQKVAAALGDPGYRTGLRNRVLPAVEHEPVLRRLREVGTVLDVGANVGQFALVARRAFPEARIISFEPLPEPAARLRAVFDGDRKFQHRFEALSDVAQETTFYVTRADDSSSLLKVGARQVEEFPETATATTRSVSTARLDELTSVLDLSAVPILLKIDTQGTELAVLRGADQLLPQVRWVLVEASFVELYEGQDDAGAVTAHLVERGWKLRSVHDVKVSRRNGEPIQADFLFEAGGRGRGGAPA